MSKCIINNTNLWGILSQGNFNILHQSKIDYIKNTDLAYSINRMQIGDLEFEDILIIKTDFGFQFLLFAKNNIILKDADEYFYSEGSDNFYNDIYKEKGWERRRYFDSIDTYHINLDVRPEIERYCLSIRFESKN